MDDVSLSDGGIPHTCFSSNDNGLGHPNSIMALGTVIVNKIHIHFFFIMDLRC